MDSQAESANEVNQPIQEDALREEYTRTQSGGNKRKRPASSEVEVQEVKPNKKIDFNVWEIFKRVDIDGVQYGICTICNTKLKAALRNGTKSLLDHKEKHDKEKKGCVDIKEMYKKASEKKKFDDPENHYFDQDKSRMELAKMIVLHEYPLSIVAHVGFRNFVHSLQPQFKIVSRNTVKSDILKLYEATKAKMMKVMEKLDSKVAITTDMWSCEHTNKRFMVVTSHYIEDSWKLQSLILRFKLKLVEYYYTKLFDVGAFLEIEKVREHCYDILHDYQCKSKSSDPYRTSSSSFENLEIGSSKVDDSDPLANFDKFVNVTSSNAIVNSVLDFYLEESVLPRTMNFDVLSWWKTQGIKFPTLRKIARDLLAVPVSTMASESASSTSGRIISPHRSRLHPETLEALMCTRSWLWNELNASTSMLDCLSSASTFCEEDPDEGSSGMCIN